MEANAHKGLVPSASKHLASFGQKFKNYTSVDPKHVLTHQGSITRGYQAGSTSATEARSDIGHQRAPGGHQGDGTRSDSEHQRAPGKAKQSKARQINAKQCKAMLSNAKQSIAKQSIAKQCKAIRSNAEQCKAKHRKAKHGKIN